MTITPVLLSGGNGTRLWPASRKSFPKQFAPLIGEHTLFQASALRLSGSEFGAPVVMTGAEFRFIVAEQLSEIGIDPAAVLIEPSARNTAPAILAAALYLAAKDPEALMLVAPSDHVVPDSEAFARVVHQGVPIARQGRIVTFGIQPSHPETGYGYLELDGTPSDNVSALRRFVEKPDEKTAADMIAAGNFLWNAGIFLFEARTMILAFETYAPEFLEPVRAALKESQCDLGFLRLAADPWKNLPDLSIDYAIMENASNLSVVRFAEHWSDLGGWDAIWREAQKDKPAIRGVVTDARSTAVDCDNVLLRSEEEGMELVGIGLRDLIVVTTRDAVLVANMNRAQDVREAVGALRKKNARQAENFPRDHRPWGWYETLALAERFQVKRIVVKPGAALSLQSHFHRSEHWVVVSGTARVTIDDTVTLVTENQSIYVPVGSVHRMENPGKVPMVLIEVQTGAYLAEDDIIRYEDVYART